MSTGRNTATRDHHRRAIATRKPPCALCGEPIDYTLPHTHPRAYVVDHITPLHTGGTDDIHNKQAAHRNCNRTKGTNTSGPIRRSQSLTWGTTP